MSACRARADCNPMSRIMSSSATFSVALGSAFAFAESSLAQTTSAGSGTAPPRADLHDLARIVDHLALGQRLSDRAACGQKKGVGDAPAHDELVDLGREGLQGGELGP